MKKRNILILLSILILIIISAISYIFILEGDTNKINNISTDFQLNKSIDKNRSLNNTDNTSNYGFDKNLSKNYNNPSSYNNQDSIKKDSNDYYDEAMEAKLTIERKVLEKNEIAGYPVYKDSRLDAWLVPIFDKNTKQFVGSVYVYVGQGESRAYVMGPDSYSDYKDVISGKTTNHDSNKYVKKVNKKNSKKSIKQTKKDNKKSQNKSNTNLKKDINSTPTLNQQAPTIESINNMNSTS